MERAGSTGVEINVIVAAVEVLMVPVLEAGGTVPTAKEEAGGGKQGGTSGGGPYHLKCF